ncbi:MAG: aminotransferase class I/II-fold pyridoxal phosphate-dependent enzyme [candidate division Zixibacteria bacterium]|nr:aminotransferase class I/II-fold pyridoxal phosphate-dependent enzyme [candidate division Zixibacteria bacterium]MBU1469509.1 aminotransferase class I/II-fold pyridoxal phosphate-dependent enzyme [candidate division Zixibacteria bacterium]MBU2624925.1 aminotransferase class I/II-fold pyridoxal phosphate-dependent enzyme [candidate division Zixibacteria bacterium]
MPLKKVMIEPSEMVMKLPTSVGSEFDGIRRRLAARDISVVDLGGIAPPLLPIVDDILSQSDLPVHIDGAKAKAVETALKEKISDWIHSKFEVRLDPKTEIMLTTGNTPATFYALQAFVDPGQRVYLPDPAFSLYRSSALAAGAEVTTYELTPRTDFLPNLDKLRSSGSDDSKLMLINYPHNPTSTMADESFYEKLLRFAQKNNLLILSDAVYNTHVWERHAHPAMISLPKAKFKTIELFTFSFMFDFPMLKLGFAVGCKEFLSPLRKMFESFNSRPSGADLQIANALMDRCDDIIEASATALGEKRKRLEDGISELKWEIQPSHATPFLWIKLPLRRLSLNFCRMLLKRTGVVTLPGISFGEKGEGFMRISVAVRPDTIDSAVTRIMEHSKFYQRRFRTKQGGTDA